MKTYEEVQQDICSASTAAEAAALWWCEVVAHPRFDNGDQSEAGGLAMMMAMLTHSRRPRPSQEMLDRFREALQETLEMYCRQHGGVTLGVDYHPSDILSECADRAGLDEVSWPWKTIMEVTPNRVTAAHGYSSPSKVIWEK